MRNIKHGLQEGPNEHLDMALQFEQDKTTYIDRRLSLYDPVSPPEYVLSISGMPIATRGNFSVISGKAKARKSFFVSAIVAAALSTRFENITCDVRNARVLYIDTEQSEYHCHKVLRRIASASGLIDYDIEERLYFILLREDATVDRFKLIEQAIYDRARTGIDFVVIDGIRDLLFDINDAEQSTVLVDKLMEWSAQFDIHILCVLHENKGNDQLRGHLGTESQNKAETVIQVERIDDRSSKVEAKYTRNMEFPAFVLEIDNDGNMAMKAPEGKPSPIECDPDSLRTIANEAFTDKAVYTSKQDFNRAIRAFHVIQYSKPIGEKKAYTMIDNMESFRIITVNRINSRSIEIRRYSEFAPV